MRRDPERLGLALSLSMLWHAAALAGFLFPGWLARTPVGDWAQRQRAAPRTTAARVELLQVPGAEPSGAPAVAPSGLVHPPATKPWRLVYQPTGPHPAEQGARAPAAASNGHPELPTPASDRAAPPERLAAIAVDGVPPPASDRPAPRERRAAAGVDGVPPPSHAPARGEAARSPLLRERPATGRPDRPRQRHAPSGPTGKFTSQNAVAPPLPVSATASAQAVEAAALREHRAAEPPQLALASLPAGVLGAQAGQGHPSRGAVHRHAVRSGLAAAMDELGVALAVAEGAMDAAELDPQGGLAALALARGELARAEQLLGVLERSQAGRERAEADGSHGGDGDAEALALQRVHYVARTLIGRSERPSAPTEAVVRFRLDGLGYVDGVEIEQLTRIGALDEAIPTILHLAEPYPVRDRWLRMTLPFGRDASR